MRAETAHHVAVMDSVFSRVPATSESLDLYRSDDVTRSPGEEFHDPGFVSASRSPDGLPPGTLRRVHVPAGSSAVDMGEVYHEMTGHEDAEREVLLNRGTRFQVEPNGSLTVVPQMTQKAAKAAWEHELRGHAGKWIGLDAHDYEGTTGNSGHITRTERGMIPAVALAHLKGASGEVPGEHRNRSGPEWESFKSDIAENGIRDPVFVTVDHGREPVISEGSHRRDAAAELGMSHVPAEIRYYGHAEQQGTVLDRVQVKPGVVTQKAASWLAWESDREQARELAQRLQGALIAAVPVKDIAAEWADIVARQAPGPGAAESYLNARVPQVRAALESVLGPAWQQAWELGEHAARHQVSTQPATVTAAG
jgi:hypothetical protein